MNATAPLSGCTQKHAAFATVARRRRRWRVLECFEIRPCHFAIKTRLRPLHRMPPKIALTLAAAACLLVAAPPGWGAGLGPIEAPTLSTLIPTPASASKFVRRWAGGPQWRAQSAASNGTAQSGEDPVDLIEAQVRQLLGDAQRQQLQLALLRQRLAAAESVSAWVPFLLLGAVALVVMVVWLALRGQRLQRLLRVQTRRADALADAEADALAEAGVASAPAAMTAGGTPLFATRPAASMVAMAGPGAMLAGQAAAASAGRPAAAPVLQNVSTPPLATDARGAALRERNPLSLGTGVPQRPVSVEELLDLDQQVDFFIVLGQAQSAVDLLLSHVRATGGANALPYLRLLQIYRQQGDEEAFERTRDRFNQRFNAQAPDWRGDLAAGRCLEQYPDIIVRLQRAWPQPLRAETELESLLLRRDDLEPFDLPAFHDILTLHALVRDLPALPVVPTLPALSSPAAPAPMAVPDHPASLDQVDLLLPLGEETPDITSPRPRVAEPGTVARAMLADWVFARAATGLPIPGAVPAPNPADLTRSMHGMDLNLDLDLDLTDYGPAPREFTRPAAFTDVDMRHDSRMSDLAAFDDSDLLPPATTRR